ncbi:MAG: hypothetical protein AAGL66_14440, partial [Pseudomonadota bacterium]
MATIEGDSGEFAALRRLHVADERDVLADLMATAEISTAQRQQAQQRAVQLIERIRSAGDPGLMELFLAEYGLST